MFPRSGARGMDSGATPLANPTPGEKSRAVAYASRHGDRIRIYVGASQLWGMLDLEQPTTHGNPESGFSEETIEIEKRGR